MCLEVEVKGEVRKIITAICFSPRLNLFGAKCPLPQWVTLLFSLWDRGYCRDILSSVQIRHLEIGQEKDYKYHFFFPFALDKKAFLLKLNSFINTFSCVLASWEKKNASY